MHTPTELLTPRAAEVSVWTNELAPAQASDAPLSVNETLARSMTERFINEMRERSIRALVRSKPPAVAKRAAAYRATCRWFEQTLPAELLILIERFGPQDGKDKGAGRCYLYWNIAYAGRRLTALAAQIGARNAGLIECPIAILTEHALHRLFQRLNTIDYRAVLQELNGGIDRLFWLQLELLHGKISPVLVPTPLGALVFKYAGPEEGEAPFIAVTWLSDERMRESEFKLRAVQEARAERGAAVPSDEGWLVISRARIARMEDASMDDEKRLLEVFAASRPCRSRGV